MATFSTKSLHFPGGVPKKPKKTKDFGLFRPRLRQDSKIFGFFLVFWVPPQEMAKKTKKTKDFGLFFWFFWYLLRKWQRFPPKACIFLEGYQKNQKTPKILDSSRPRLCQDSKIFGFFGFFGTSSGNGNVFHQKLAFSWRGTKKTKKNKDFGLFRPRLRQDSKIFGFFGFLGTSSGNGNVFHQKLAFSWRGTKKTKKNQRVWTLQASPSPRL